MTEEQSLSQHRLELARGLADDIELSRFPPEQLLLKVSRLARLMEEQEIQKFVWYELNGYGDTDESRKMMDRVWRWTDKTKDEGWWAPLAAINSTLVAYEAQLAQLRVPDVQLSMQSSNPNEFVTGFIKPDVGAPINAVLARQFGLSTQISTLSGIRSRVLAQLHAFVTTTYIKLAFSGAAESIFQRHQVLIDGYLRDAAPEILEKIPSISNRLAEGDLEAISQAMTSCRRMLNVVADSLSPNSSDPVTIDGTKFETGSDKYVSRLKLFLRQRCQSESRRKRLGQLVQAINEKASAGVHSDITTGEASALFLWTYQALGEIAEIARASTSSE